jgi:hypothetical protein
MSRNRGHCIIIQNSPYKHNNSFDSNSSDNEESHDRVIIDNGKDNIARILNPSDLITDASLAHLKKPIHSNTKKEFRSKQAHVIDDNYYINLFPCNLATSYSRESTDHR